MRRATGALVILFLLVAPVTADGMFWVGDDSLWRLNPEEQQLAVIQFTNSTEVLLISITPDLNGEGEEAVWIFPVPAAPEEVTLDIFQGFPRMMGYDLENRYAEKTAFSTMDSLLFATFPVSLPAIPPRLFFHPLGTGNGLKLVTQGGFGDSAGTDDVLVYSTVEKMGVTSELITAKNAGALDRYLEEKGLTLPADSDDIINGYIGNDYSFVVSFISDLAQYREETETSQPYHRSPATRVIGIDLRFPVDRPFFPLKPTSVYGNMTIPVLLYVNGFVSPQIYDSISGNTTIGYFIRTTSYFNDPGEFRLVDPPVSSDRYTKIIINSPAASFQDDLWIDPSSPVSLTIKEAVLPFLPLLGIIAFIVFSLVSALIAGRICFHDSTVPVGQRAVLGLWNCGTMIGFVMGTKRFFKRWKLVHPRRFILVFYLVFGILFMAYTLVLSPDSVRMLAEGLGFTVMIWTAFLFHAPWLMIPLLLAFLAFDWVLYRRIEPEEPAKYDEKRKS